jgi:hypothetical protein
VFDYVPVPGFRVGHGHGHAGVGIAMDLRDRFFGKGTSEPGGLPVASLAWPDQPSFQLLFPAPLDLDQSALTQALRDYHPELAEATAELIRIPAPPPLPESTGGPPAIMGLVAWGRHVVKVVGFDAPMPASVLDHTVGLSHYDPALKEAAYAHASHVLLFYAGYEPNVLEQHVALAATAAVLAQFGAIITVNETAHTSVPAPALLPHEEDGGDTLQAMRTLPLPFLYAGFVKIEADNEPGVWMRTYGCHVFSLPDLAIRTDGIHHGTVTFNLFSNMLAYLRESGQTFVPGDMIGAGEGQFLRMREPKPHEWFLESAGRMLVAEPASPEEVGPS